MVGLLVGALFVRRQRRLADPMIDLALFRVPGFSAALGINVIGLFAAFGTWLFLAQHLQLVRAGSLAGGAAPGWGRLA